jgi:hypothetical protein
MMGTREEPQRTIDTREELIAFLSLLRQDLTEHGESTLVLLRRSRHG